MTEEQTQLDFMRLGISLPCTVPIRPGDPTVVDERGFVPLEERTEFCAVDAWWTISIQPICDIHLRIACESMEIDFDDLAEEAGGLNDTERKPWAERHRYRQDQVPKPPPGYETRDA